MTAWAMESPESCALQLRKLLTLGPQEGDHGTANMAEAFVTQLTARVPLDANEKNSAKRLVADLREFFLSPRPFSHDTIVQDRNHLSRRITLLQRAVARYAVMRSS